MALQIKDTYNSDLHDENSLDRPDEDSLGQFDADNIVPKAKTQKELSQDSSKQKQSVPKTQVQTLPKDDPTRRSEHNGLENSNVEPLSQNKDYYKSIDTFSDTSCDLVQLVPKDSPSGQRKSSLPRNIPGGPPELEKQCSQPVPHKCPEKLIGERKGETQDNMKGGDGTKKRRKQSSEKKMKEDHFIPGHSTSLPSLERKDNQSKSIQGPGGAPGISRGGDQAPSKERMKVVAKIALPLLGGAATIVAAPLVVSALGFGAGGIVAGSLAAKAMSFAWTTGYGVGLVSALQSIGAAGFSLLGLGTLGAGGAVVTAGVEKMIDSTKSSKDNQKNGSGSRGSGNGYAGTSNESHVGNKDEKKTEENSSSDDETGSDDSNEDNEK